MNVSPRLKIIYLLAVSTAVFILGHWGALVLLGFQALLWIVAGVPAQELRAVRKSIGFMAMILLCYALFSAGRDLSLLRVADWDLQISTKGVLDGAVMCVRLLTILVAGTIVRNGLSRQQYVSGLIGLGMSNNLAQLFESTLGYFEGREGLTPKGGGKSKGIGGKRIILKRLLRGDFTVVEELINQRLVSARATLADNDSALVFALTTVVVGVRFIKVVAGLPLAPGHKNLIIIPSYVAAASLTQSRLAATSIGAVSGAINFLSGFGRFGIFDIFQHVVPAFTVDMLVKTMSGSRSILMYAFIGLVAGVARVSAVLFLAILFRMPGEFYLLLLPFVVSQCLFGVLSAPVSKYLVSHIKMDGATE